MRRIYINGESISTHFSIMYDKAELKIIDAKIGALKKFDKKAYAKLVFMIAVFVLSSTIFPYANTNVFDPAGNELFGLVVSVAKWVFIAKGGWEIIQKIATGCDIGDISGVVTKYGIGYAAILLLPKILTMLGESIDKIKL